MFGLTRYRPFTELERRGSFFDRFFNENLPVLYREFLPLSAKITPAFDVIEKENHYLVKAEVPGFTKEQIDISVSEGILTIRGERKDEKVEEKENYYHKEISCGSFSRSVQLPGEINSGEIKASLKDGILNVEIPRVEAKKPEAVKVEVQ
jgi:HSP20 family protein